MSFVNHGCDKIATFDQDSSLMTELNQNHQRPTINSLQKTTLLQCIPRRQVTSRPPETLYVGKIPKGVTQEGLNNLFIKFGNVLKVKLVRRESGGDNFGFVTYSRKKMANKAVEELNSKPPLFLNVRFQLDNAQQETPMVNPNIKFDNQIGDNSSDEDWGKETELNKQRDSNNNPSKQSNVVHKNDNSSMVKRADSKTGGVPEECQNFNNSIVNHLDCTDLIYTEKQFVDGKFNRKEKITMQNKKDEKNIANLPSDVEDEVLRSLQESKLKCEAWVNTLITVNKPSEKESKSDDIPSNYSSQSGVKYMNSISVNKDIYDCHLCRNQLGVEWTGTTKTDIMEHLACSHPEEWLEWRSKQNNQFEDTRMTLESTSVSNESQQISKLIPVSPDSWLGLKVGQVQKVAVLHVDSPTSVYLCPDIAQLSSFQAHLYKLGASLEHDPLYLPLPGSTVLAKSLQDDIWYRAIIEGRVGEDKINYFCPDFGFTDVVDLTRVRRINRRLMQSFFIDKKFLACRCVLADWRSNTNSYSKREVRNLMKLLPVSDAYIRVSIWEEKDGYYVVDIPGVNKITVAGKEETNKDDELLKLRLKVKNLTSLKASLIE